MTDVSELPAEAKVLLWREADLCARILLNDSAYAVLAEPELTMELREAWCQLMHSGAYLADRVGYEMHPWPKNKFKLEISYGSREAAR